mgnify:CR=1 FL=1
MESLEKKLPFVKLVLILTLFEANLCFAQNSVAPQTTMPYLTVKLWALLDPMPGSESAASDDLSLPFYQYSVQEIKKLSPYVFEGMIFGFDFEYTPSDKTRAVDEYFSVNFNRESTQNTSEFSLKDFSKNISYSDPYIEDNCLYCQAEFALTHQLSERIVRKQSVSMKKIKGKGQGKVSEGQKGIEKAFEQAIKNAVRTYAQGIRKNKPKEINGTVILKDQPRIYIKSGYYIVDSDFFIENIEITDYTTF